jgi:hypothetical protein
MPSELPLTSEQEEYIATLLEFAVEEGSEPIAEEIAVAVVGRVTGALPDDHPLAGEADAVIARGLEALDALSEAL